MRSFEIGLVVPVAQFGPDRLTPRWSDILEIVTYRNDGLRYDLDA